MTPKKIAAFAIGPIGSAAFGLATLPIITWLYSADDIGRIAMLQVASSFSTLLFSLGLDQAYVREYHEAKDKTALLKATLTPGLAILTVVLGTSLLIPGALSHALFSVDSVEVSWLLAACLFATFISKFLSLTLRMQERGTAFSISQVLPKALTLTIIAYYYIRSFEFNFLHLIIAYTISIVATTVILALNTRKEWLAFFHCSVDSTHQRNMLRFGAPLIMSGIAYWGLNTMDKLFLRSMSTFEELGIYTVASSFAGVAIIFQSIFSTVWAPTVYKWAAEGINNRKIDQITEYVLAAVVLLFVLAGLFSWVVSYFLPERYFQVQYILVPCMACPLFYTLSETTVVGLGITRKSSYAMFAAVIAALINIIGNYFLIPPYGATGAAISTAFSFWGFLVLRTELSCFVWRKIQRTKLYTSTLACLFAAIGTAIFGKVYSEIAISLWALAGIISLFFFKRELWRLYVDVRKAFS